MSLESYLEAYKALPPDERAAVAADALRVVGNPKFVPSPGPQTDAWFCEADVLLYGGEPGGGKSGLLCGLALCEHERSLLMRREGTALTGGGGLIEDLLRINGSRDGYSGASPPTLRTDDGRIITFGSAPYPGDEQKYQGRPRDFLGVDEASQFTEDQIRFLMAWVRTTTKGQRVRTVLATNPPATAEGEWITDWFAPWLDRTHPNPAEPGELRWFISTPDGDEEVDGPGMVLRDGREFYPLSRTFIPAALSDNPFLSEKDYRRQLGALGPSMAHIASGDFQALRQDDPWQAIPTDWIVAAQDRWAANPPEHAPMCAMGVDPAQGGKDETVIACRWDGWFGEMIAEKGEDTPTGREIAALVIKYRTDRAAVIIDMGGGYGGAAKMVLEDNGIQVHGHKGAAESTQRTVDGQYRFANIRSQVIWRFREALDPSQPGGSGIALPPDRKLRADLSAPRYQVTSRGVVIEAKEKVVERLGRSTDRGDAVVMAWSGGPTLLTHGNQWRQMRKAHGSPMTVKRGRR